MKLTPGGAKEDVTMFFEKCNHCFNDIASVQEEEGLMEQIWTTSGPWATYMAHQAHQCDLPSISSMLNARIFCTKVFFLGSFPSYVLALMNVRKHIRT